MSKIRLDQLIVKKGLVESRQKAQSMIMANLVSVNGEFIDKSGTLIEEDSVIFIKDTLKYVSRAAYKLETALKYFKFDFTDKIVLDIGASTGGFTDLCLQNKAKKVYAVDVGKNLLHEKLRRDNRVVNIEKINFRHITFDIIGEKADFVVSDVSFISLTYIIPNIIHFCHNDTKVCLLIKPQFEAGAKFVGKKGIVKNKEVHIDVIRKIVDFATKNNFTTKGLVKSAMKGAKGNIEYLLYLEYKKTERSNITNEDIKRAVYEEYCYYSETTHAEY